MKKLLIYLFALVASLTASGRTLSPSYLAYIEDYHQIAIRQQQSHGIPASIILAQGLLESGAGNGRLAVEANNHFGIKCHEWTGDRIFHDDDERNECFRKYRRASDSFEDHSMFLVNRPRYKSLFLLKPTDYVNWAHGLKAAGYATDPEYAYKLIRLIERYNLHQYDTIKKGLFASKDEKPDVIQNVALGTIRAVYKSNYIKIIVASHIDTYPSLAQELKISERRLRRYNEVDENAILQQGDIIYLAKKKKKAAYPNRIHVVRRGETLYGIAQIYGIQLISLYELNGLSFTEGAYIGQILKLR
ncbi:MAG: glucosaminidase domain-containing protein [Paludibacter sp.]|nr:glucosaminidase domain-containing protein [Paludibacter sp.]